MPVDRVDPIAGHGLTGALALADQTAAAMISVLLLGETGVGKDVMAERIYVSSDRRVTTAMPCAGAMQGGKATNLAPGGHKTMNLTSQNLLLVCSARYRWRIPRITMKRLMSFIAFTAFVIAGCTSSTKSAPW